MDVCVISKRVKGKSSSSLNDSIKLQFGFIFIPSFRSEIEFHQHALAQESAGLAHWGIARHV